MRRAMRITVCLLAGLAIGCGVIGDDDGQERPREPAATEVGLPLGAAVKATIGPSGGALSSADGRLTVTVPAGAVAAGTEFSIEPISNLSHGGIGNGYRLGPAGVELAAPVTLTFAAPEAGESRSGIGALGIATQDAEGFWSWQPSATRDEAAKKVSVETTHFSDWSLVEGVQLRPLLAVVQLGSSIDLEVEHCYPKPREDSLAWLGYDCGGGLAPLGSASDWSVQGVAGGNATWGTVSGEAAKARYTAPARRPDPSTVAVSARWNAGEAGGTTILVSHLSVGQPATYHGTFTVDSRPAAGPAFTAGGTATATPAVFDNGDFDDGIDMTGYDVAGSVTLDLPVVFGDATCTTDQPTVPLDENSRINLYKQPWAFGWDFLVQWNLKCTNPEGQTFDWPLMFMWFQGCPTASGLVETRVPASDPNRPSGEYTRFCTADTTTVTWDFAQ